MLVEQYAWAKIIKTFLAWIDNLQAAFKTVYESTLGAFVQLGRWFLSTWFYLVPLAIILFVHARFRSFLERVLYGRLRWWRIQGMKAKDPKRFILRCYQEMETGFRVRGCPRASSCTPLEYKVILNRQFKSVQSEVRLITRHFIKVRYSALSLTSDAVSEVCVAYETLLQAARFY